MKKVITINLNGTAYQVEEAGFEKLQTYLDQAAAALSDNPDKNEILSDLEQAIAEKSRAYLTSAKNVISTDEIDRIIASMGPVQGTDETKTGGSADTSGQAQSGATPKKLYLLREGAVFMGVCNGLAAYFNIDVTIVRIIFVVLTLVTSGGFILGYVVLAVVIPYANTPEEKVAAHGMAYTAQQLIQRAKTKYEAFAAGKGWDHKDPTEWMKKNHEEHWKRQEMKEKRRQEKRAYRYEMRRAEYARNPLWDTLNALIWMGVIGFTGWLVYTHFAEIQAFVNNVVLYFDTL
jgi:phage shock protein PspC (stress-responsive transcriptional regulator)